MAGGPLSGVRVFDLTLAMVGPWSTQNLGAMGADVIHIEPPPREGAFGVPPSINGTSIGYISWNMNKRGIILDMKSPQDRANAYELLKTCDVFVMNMRPDVAQRLGVDYETVSEINDQIIYCAVTGWGQDGPMREVPGADPQVRYFTGFHEGTGEEGGETEVYRHSTQADATTGNYATQAIVMALLARKRTGHGQRVDVSMLNAVSALQSARIGEFLASGRHPLPLGSAAQSTAPDRAFLCADQRYLGVSVTSESQWRAFCEVIEHLDLLDDERFRTNADRVDHRAELSTILEPVLGAMPVDYWELEFNRVGVPCGHPLRWSELRHHRQVLENRYLVEVETDAPWGQVVTGGPAWHFSATPASWRTTPMIGEHNDEVLRELEERRRAAASPATPAPAAGDD